MLARCCLPTVCVILFLAPPGHGGAPGAGAAPDFILPDAYGQPVSLSGYHGSVMWLSFGATW